MSSISVLPHLADFYANGILQNENDGLISNVNDTQGSDKNVETTSTSHFIDNTKSHDNNNTLASIAYLSTTDYDNLKNCATDLDKRPTSIEYITYFNCGRVSENEDNGQTIRDFTLIVDENKTILSLVKGIL